MTSTMSGRRFIRGRGGRALALLATSGLLGLSAVVAGTTSPALADNFFVQLSASATTLPVGGTTTLTATTGIDVGPTPWYIDIYDVSADTLLRSCGSGTTCAVTVSQNAATTHRYVAFVAGISAILNPPDIQGTSNDSYVSWTNSGMQVQLTGPELDNVPSDGPATYTATSNINVQTIPDGVLAIYDETTSTLVGFTTIGTRYAAKITPSVAGDFLVAFAESYIQVVSQYYPPPLSTIQASSNVLLTRAFYG